jgi:hypothetical protein
MSAYCWPGVGGLVKERAVGLNSTAFGFSFDLVAALAFD